MRVILVGGSGTIGRAIAAALGPRHSVIAASRTSPDAPVDATSPDSVTALFKRHAPVDAVVVAAGGLLLRPLADLSPEAFRGALDDKLMAQVTVALVAQHLLADQGSITLTSGIIGHEPIRSGAHACCVNRAIEGFVAGAAVDLARGLRINAVSPGVVAESWDKVGAFVPGFETVPAARVAQAYVRALEGGMTGRVLPVP